MKESPGIIIKKSAVQIWREKNKERLKDEQARIRATEARKIYMQEFRKRNKEHKLATIQKHNWDRKVRLLTVVADGGEIECVRCKIRDKRILQIHHKFGNGKRDRKLYYKADKFIKLKSDKNPIPINEVEIRCCNCNIIAEYDDLKRRYTNIIGFDENFNPIWKELPYARKPLTPLQCDYCGDWFMPNKRRSGKRAKHKNYCNRECMDLARRKN